MKIYKIGKNIWIDSKNSPLLIGFIPYTSKLPIMINGEIDFDEVRKRTLGFTIC